MQYKINKESLFDFADIFVLYKGNLAIFQLCAKKIVRQLFHLFMVRTTSWLKKFKKKIIFFLMRIIQ